MTDHQGGVCHHAGESPRAEHFRNHRHVYGRYRRSLVYGAVNAAVSDGLVSGTGDNLFAPNALITREQMAVMVTKALGAKAPTVDGTELNPFSDSSVVSSWAVSGMEEAVKAGIVSGMTADTLAPQDNATRAQAVVMIYKMLTVLGK